MKALREAPSIGSQLHNSRLNSKWTKGSLGLWPPNACESFWRLRKPLKSHGTEEVTVAGIYNLLPGKQAWNENLLTVCCQFAKLTGVPQIIPDVMSHHFLTKKKVGWLENIQPILFSGWLEIPSYQTSSYSLTYDRTWPQLMEPRATCFSWSGLQVRFPGVFHFEECHYFQAESTFSTATQICPSTVYFWGWLIFLKHPKICFTIEFGQMEKHVS